MTGREKRATTIINRGTKRAPDDTTEEIEMDGHGPSQQGRGEGGRASSSSCLNELVEESPTLEDVRWEINHVDDICEPSVEPTLCDFFDRADVGTIRLRACPNRSGGGDEKGFRNLVCTRTCVSGPTCYFRER